MADKAGEAVSDLTALAGQPTDKFEAAIEAEDRGMAECSKRTACAQFLSWTRRWMMKSAVSAESYGRTLWDDASRSSANRLGLGSLAGAVEAIELDDSWRKAEFHLNADSG